MDTHGCHRRQSLCTSTTITGTRCARSSSIPVSHNIEWHSVVSLLEAVGSVVENHDGTVAATVGSETEYFEAPAHKDIDTQTVAGLRRILSSAGYGTGAGHVAVKGQND